MGACGRYRKDTKGVVHLLGWREDGLRGTWQITSSSLVRGSLLQTKDFRMRVEAETREMILTAACRYFQCLPSINFNQYRYMGHMNKAS